MRFLDRLKLSALILALSLLFGFGGALLGRFFLSPWRGLFALLFIFALGVLLLPWERLTVVFSQEALADDLRKSLHALTLLADKRPEIESLLAELDKEALKPERLDQIHSSFSSSFQIPQDTLHHLREMLFPSHRRIQAIPVILLFVVAIGAALLVRPITAWLAL